MNVINDPHDASAAMTFRPLVTDVVVQPKSTAPQPPLGGFAQLYDDTAGAAIFALGSPTGSPFNASCRTISRSIWRTCIRCTQRRALTFLVEFPAEGDWGRRSVHQRRCSHSRVRQHADVLRRGARRIAPRRAVADVPVLENHLRHIVPLGSVARLYPAHRLGLPHRTRARYWRVHRRLHMRSRT